MSWINSRLVENKIVTLCNHLYKLNYIAMKYVLVLVLLVASIMLMYLGIKNEIQPPVWTGIGFLAIIGLFLSKEKK